MNAFRLLRAILREIFDESSYERFCTLEGLQRGRQSYSLYLSRRAHKIKCC